MNNTADREGAGSIKSAARRFIRNLIDIALFAALIFTTAAGLELLVAEDAPWTQLIPLFGTPLAALLLIWGLLRLQAQGFPDIGLAFRGNTTRIILQGLAIAAFVFALSVITEAMGYERDFSAVRARLEGQPLNLLIFLVYAFVGAGLYEEAAFRGFALNRFARMFGESRTAWVIAALLQGALFGLAHAYQGAYGMLYTGTLGAVLGFVFLLNGRNLWPLVIGHGLYDAARGIYFYVIWTYGP